MDPRTATEILQRLGDLEGSSIRYRKGVVTAASPLSVVLGGASVPFTDVRAVGGGTFTFGDVVSVLVFGNDLLVLGGDASPVNLSLLNNFVNHRDYYSGTEEGCSYQVVGGRVFLTGLVNSLPGAPGVNNPFASIPEGIRPTRAVRQIALLNGTNQCNLLIEPSGNLSVFGYTTLGQWFSIAGFNWPIASGF